LASEAHEKTATPAGDWRVRQAGYDRTGATYSGGNYGSRLGRAYLRARTESLVREADARFGADAPLDVLEIGCGTGLTLAALQSLRPRWRLHGVDFSRTMLTEAAQRTRGAGADPVLALANAIELPFATEAFDVVYATRFIHQFPHADKLRIAAEVERVLRQGGLAGLEFYARALNRLRYYTTQRNKYATRELYDWHYPSRGEVREIAGGDPHYAVLRYPGDRVVNRILGYRAFTLGERLVTHVPGLRWLASERWGFYTPPGRRGRAAPADRAVPASPLEVLRCPVCRGALAHAPEAEQLVCAHCGLAYAFVDGIPDLLSHEAHALAG
jgi:ubiquinone/menaquinone biosynthesis C-methylase UbiE/uncharacterized protein YbaR (Trm112 family)